MAGTLEVFKKAESGVTLPKKGILSLQMIDLSDQSFTLKFRHHCDIYLDLIVNQIEKVQYKIAITNMTQHKRKRLSLIRPRNPDNSFIIPLGKICGEINDEFDVELSACKTDDRLGLLTWGRLDSPCKLLQRNTVDSSRMLLPKILSVLLYSVKLVF